jgi:hypothetical protein
VTDNIDRPETKAAFKALHSQSYRAASASYFAGCFG